MCKIQFCTLVIKITMYYDNYFTYTLHNILQKNGCYNVYNKLIQF